MINIEDLVEVKLNEPDDFLKIRETLSRIGVASKKDKTLYQSCHILHKQGKYYIVHFKELFALDGKATDFSDNDKNKRPKTERALVTHQGPFCFPLSRKFAQYRWQATHIPEAIWAYPTSLAASLLA